MRKLCCDTGEKTGESTQHLKGKKIDEGIGLGGDGNHRFELHRSFNSGGGEMGLAEKYDSLGA